MSDPTHHRELMPLAGFVANSVRGMAETIKEEERLADCIPQAFLSTFRARLAVLERRLPAAAADGS